MHRVWHDPAEEGWVGNEAILKPLATGAPQGRIGAFRKVPGFRKKTFSSTRNRKELVMKRSNSFNY